MHLLAANGTLRTILVLLIIWLLLRMWARSQRPSGPASPRSGWAPPQQRPKGEVRIERIEDTAPHRPPAHAEDADFEEIK
ncbi:MAG TPA: hypothetical protein VGE21_02430 [Flavobacteriales bacterium]